MCNMANVIKDDKEKSIDDIKIIKYARVTWDQIHKHREII